MIYYYIKRRPIRFTSVHSRVIGLCFLLLLTGGFSCAGGKGPGSSAEKIPPLLPHPQSIILKSNAKFEIAPSVEIILDDKLDDSEKIYGTEISEAVSKISKDPLKIIKAAITPDSRGIIIGAADNPVIRSLIGAEKLQFTPAMEEEGYVLDVSPDRIIIVAPKAAGRLYGVETLLQLLSINDERAYVTGVLIRDLPGMKIRGILDDVSHGQVSTMDDFKRIIKTMARFKLNTYVLYIEDMFIPVKYPLIGANRGAITARMVQELQSYAAPFNVTVVPAFPSPGNMENICAIPEFTHLAEFPGASCFNVSDPETFNFVHNILSEMLQAFQGRYFFLDGSDVKDFGQGSGMENARRIGIKKMYLNYISGVDSVITASGKQVFFSIPEEWQENVNDLPKEMGLLRTLTDRDSFPNQPANRPVLVSPLLREDKRCFPEYNHFFNLVSSVTAMPASSAAGGIITAYRHHGGKEFFREHGWIGYLYTAGTAWNPVGVTEAQLLNSIVVHQFGIMHSTFHRGIGNFLSLEQSSPEGLTIYQEFWRPPFTREYTQQELTYLNEISEKANVIEDQLRSFQDEPSLKKDAVSYIQYSLRQTRWISKKAKNIRNISAIEKMLAEGGGVKGTVTEAVALASDLVRDLIDFRSEFERLWTLTNQKAGLEFPLQRFDEQIAVLDTKIKQLKSNRWYCNPLIPAQWIWLPADIMKNNVRDECFFRRVFSVAVDSLESVYLQVQCMTHGVIAVNGQYIGEVETRAYDSPVLLKNVVKIFNVAPYVKVGQNCITIEAVAYPEMDSVIKAGLNIFGEIRYQNGIKDTILTDGKWKVSPSKTKEWQSPFFNDLQWNQAQVLGKNPPDSQLEWLLPNINRLPAK